MVFPFVVKDKELLSGHCIIWDFLVVSLLLWHKSGWDDTHDHLLVDWRGILESMREFN